MLGLAGSGGFGDVRSTGAAWQPRALFELAMCVIQQSPSQVPRLPHQLTSPTSPASTQPSLCSGMAFDRTHGKQARPRLARRSSSGVLRQAVGARYPALHVEHLGGGSKLSPRSRSSSGREAPSAPDDMVWPSLKFQKHCKLRVVAERISCNGKVCCLAGSAEPECRERAMPTLGRTSLAIAELSLLQPRCFHRGLVPARWP
mmetsp:Transcript_113474/g.360699  ORF Transcript_113474/g.360699 Transcript_113474/m.360699 type:complete len:202 (+) Transcript_113474:370-975(+)